MGEGGRAGGAGKLSRTVKNSEQQAQETKKKKNARLLAGFSERRSRSPQAEKKKDGADSILFPCSHVVVIVGVAVGQKQVKISTHQ